MIAKLHWLLSVPPVYRWAITLVFVGIVVALSIAPGVERPGDSIFAWLVVNTATPIQKAMHLGVYALLALLWIWTLQGIESLSVRYAVVLVITISLGATLEWHQTNVPGRYGTLSDVLLNILGIIVGLIAAFFLL
jgi:undecaprenyl pyrophosphate phosphatase UppP